jgi:Protein of unknown function (DUF3237)
MMRMEPLYRATWTTPESWSVELEGVAGTEGRSFFIAEGRADGRLSGRLRAANYPRRRVDGTLTPDFRGVLETDDGATVLFAWQGYARSASNDVRELVGSITHVSDDDRYRWLNDRIGTVVGEVRPRVGGGSTVEIEVREIVWEPLETNV